MVLGRISQAQLARFTPKQKSEFMRNVGLFNARKGECAVTCEGMTLKVDGGIVCRRSEFFRGAFTNDFEESKTGKVHLQEVVTLRFLFWVLVYIYFSVPAAGYDLEVFGPQTNAQFFDFMFELHRQADYLQVRDLTDAVIDDLKKRLEICASQLFRGQIYPSEEVFKKAYEDPMKAVVFAYDKSNMYYEVYEPLRAELFRWIQQCYPVLCRLGDTFYDYLREAPELNITILKTMQNITSSKFIDPGPEARCTFCGDSVGQGRANRTDYAQPKFGVVADRSGGVKYFCARSACFHQISVGRSFKGTHTCEPRRGGLFCDCRR